MSYFEDFIKDRNMSRKKAACFIVGNDAVAEMGLIDNIIDSDRGDWELIEIPDKAKDLLMQVQKENENEIADADTDPTKWIWVSRGAISSHGYLEGSKELVAVFKG